MLTNPRVMQFALRYEFGNNLRPKGPLEKSSFPAASFCDYVLRIAVPAAAAGVINYKALRSDDLSALSGRSAAWLARLVRDQEVEGSNPFAPTNSLHSYGGFPSMNQMHRS